jgi:hypothetical protein
MCIVKLLCVMWVLCNFTVRVCLLSSGNEVELDKMVEVFLCLE